MIRAAALCLLLAGCATTPTPGPNDSQVRLTCADAGAAGGIGFGAEGTGAFAILSVIGTIKPGVVADLVAGECAATVAAQPAALGGD